MSFVLQLAVTIGLLAAIGPVQGSAQQHEAQRLFSIDDLFEVEELGQYYGGPYAFSADGQRLAITRVRPRRTLANFQWQFLWRNAGADVWVQLHPDAEPVNITHGVTDGSGWWSPQWSPDGGKLAMLSTRGGKVRLWVWDAATRTLRPVTTRNVDLWEVRERPYLWVSAHQLLVPLLPGDEKPHGMIIQTQTPAIACAAWPKSEKGRDVTASVLESGVPVDLSRRPQGELVLVDVLSGVQKTLATGTTYRWQLSPNRRAVAFARRHATYTPKPDERLPFGSATWGGLATLALATLDGAPIELRGKVSGDVLIESLRWSPDGTELAFIGYAAERDEPPLLYIVNVSRRTVTSRSLPALDITPIIREETQIEWTAAGQLIVQAANRVGDVQPSVTARRDWWLVGRTGAARNLTSAIDTPPRQLWPQRGRRAFVGLGGGELWRIDAVAGKAENLTSRFEPPVANLTWPSMTYKGIDEYRIPGRTYDQVIFSVQGGKDRAPYLVDLKSGGIQAIANPTSEAELMAFAPAGKTAIFSASDRTGLRVWRSHARGTNPRMLVEANTFLQGIAEGEVQQIEYTSLNGESLKGWLLLPPGYERGKRYPLLTWIYPGTVYGGVPPSNASPSSNTIFNLQIAAARGYVVLYPSMPLEPEGVTQDPMWRLSEGVLPAVDKVVEMGIADPKRLFVMGHSFGGFATYGLLTETRRFTAAVALAGLSNLISLYGQFDARWRYTDYPQEQLFQPALMEAGVIGMGSPPWRDLGRYIRNSPIFAVDRVQTPLMIIQGDMDNVALQQGEEFFMSLYRQGKRASFVRYWSEGHTVESPANIRDMWTRIFTWFDEFSQHTSSTEGT